MQNKPPPQTIDALTAALLLALLALEALAQGLRLVLAHGLALALLLAGWRPAPAAPAATVKRPEPITAQPIAAARRKRTTRRLQEVPA